MHVSPERVATERDWMLARGDRIVELINDTRERLRSHFDLEVAGVDRAAYGAEVDAVFADGDLAVNVAGLVAILRDLDVTDDHPAFVVDDLLGRELAATIAGRQPLRTLGAATFHYVDIHASAVPGEPAGADDLDAALAAGFQERLPGWVWTTEESPFSLEPRG